MLDPILNKYAVREEEISLDGIAFLTYDPRTTGLNTDRVKRLKEAILSGQESKIPLPLVCVTATGYTVVYGRHRLKGYEDAGRKVVKCLVLVDQLSEVEIRLLAYMENENAPLAMEGPDLRRLIDKFFDLGLTSSEIRGKLIVGIGHVTLDGAIADVITMRTGRAAHRANALMHKNPDISTKEAVDRSLIAGTTAATVLKSVQRLRGKKAEEWVSVQQKCAGTYSARHKSNHQWHINRLKDLEEYRQQGAPTQELVACFRKLITSAKKEVDWLESHYAKFMADMATSDKTKASMFYAGFGAEKEAEEAIALTA